jgi:hypothetical protein
MERRCIRWLRGRVLVYFSIDQIPSTLHGTKAILKSGHSAWSGGNETCGDDALPDRHDPEEARRLAHRS